VKCPQCAHEQSSAVECEHCGIIFSKWKPHEAKPEPVAEPPRDDLPPPLEAIFGDLNVLRLLETPLGTLAMMTGWPVAREFDVVDPVGRQRGSVAQAGRGAIPLTGQAIAAPWLRLRFGVFSYPSQQLAATFWRKGYLAFSEMFVDGARGERLGSVKRRFSLIRRYYDLRDASGQIFATVAGSLMSRGMFSIVDRAGQQHGEISKNWAGYTQEVAEARRFKLDFMNHHWTLAQRAVILAAAVSIDFDVFEHREDKIGIVALGD
jgi:scramblase